MEIWRIAAAAAALGALAGCSGAEEQAAQDNVTVDYQERLRTMAEGARNATFIRAIRDAGFDCQHVAGSTFQGEAGGAPVWTARCDDGRAWTIAVGPTGIAQVSEGAPAAAAAQNATE
jgi:hypothetical protein